MKKYETDLKRNTGSKAGLYIHIPFCIQKCSYCDFFSVKAEHFSDILKGKNGSLFAKRIADDIDFFALTYGIREFDSVYVGGGTPSLLSPDDFYFIFSHILKRQKIPPVEFTVEINPEDVTEALLEAAFDGGVNRISVGIQSFSDAVLAAAKRRGSREKTLTALSRIKKYKTVLSCDLIAGLKNQTYGIIRDDVRTLVDFLPEHISLYSLCTDKKRNACEEDTVAGLWMYGNDFLERSSYIRYEISNFSYKNLYKSMHNTKYWKLQNYIGVGPGACGSLFFYHSEKKSAYAVRFSACKNIDKWIFETDRTSVYEYENISNAECMEEFIMMGFRLIEGINLQTFTARFGCDIRDILGGTIKKWRTSGKLLITDTDIKLTKEGIDFLNKFLQEAFDEIERFLTGSRREITYDDL